ITTTPESTGVRSGGRVDCCGITASRPLEYTGMIIKITRSTSRISINGTTFISETTPRLPPTIIPMSHLVLRNRKAVNVPEQMPREEDSHITWRHTGPRQRERAKNLLTGFELCGNQADFVDARAAHDVDSARDFHEHYIVVAFDKSDFLGALLEDLLHARAETFPGGVFIVDLELAVLLHLHDDGLVLEFHVLLLVRRGLRNERVQALRRKRRNNHENDDQHEQNIDERHHIGRRHRSALFSSNIHPHSESPSGLCLSVSAGRETAPGGIRRGRRKSANERCNSHDGPQSAGGGGAAFSFWFFSVSKPS